MVVVENKKIFVLKNEFLDNDECK